MNRTQMIAEILSCIEICETEEIDYSEIEFNINDLEKMSDAEVEEIANCLISIAEQ